MVFILSLIIIYSSIFCLIRAEIRTSPLDWLYERYSFLIPVSFSLTLALIGLISNTSFYLDIPTEKNIYIVYIVAVLFLPILWKNISHIKVTNISFSLDLPEKILLTIILYSAFLYIHRALAPWSDQDEITKYGYWTKLIANGFTYSTIDSSDRFPKFAESLYSYFYFVLETTIFPKIIKIIGLFTTAQLLYFITYYITRKIKYGLTASLCFLITPEFSYMASSLKTDNVMMVFEFTSLVITILLFFERKQINSSVFKNYAATAIYMAIVATSIRTSAIYCLFIVSILMAYTLFLKSKKQCLLLLIFSLIICVPYFLVYWINLLSYNNPIYPLGFELMGYFPQIEYVDFYRIDHLKSNYNINLNNKIAEFIYVAAYMSFGFGTQLFDYFTEIIHPLHKGVSIGWANPVLVTMFLLLFLVKEYKRMILPLAVYFALYYLWFAGVQYTRVFLSSTAFAIFCYVCIIEYKYKFVLNRIIKKLLVLYIIMIIPIFVVYHTMYTFIRMPNNIMTIFNQEEEHNSNLRYYNFMKDNLGVLNDPFPLTFNNVQDVNRIMKSNKKMKVLTSINGPIHMFFKFGYFSTSLSNYDCLISNDVNDKNITSDMFVSLNMNEYTMWCKKPHELY
jgi:hypothetical protein